ncbi:unnamed protein product [Brachionus calyciflorus]|uniref:Rho-GAP domain-containing protein n=1 Tax=Brachionus calyciflorus TaxID=104777 RepID=A0A813M1H3_9BILA|nr:unnamed protein product [Brachionus calyciflorus]
MSQLKGFFKKITGENASYDALAKQPIIDAEIKLTLFKDATSASITALESYSKYMQKNIDFQLADKFFECKEIFRKYETKGEILNANIAHVLGTIFGKLNELQLGIHSEVVDLMQSIEANVIKPLIDYQKEVTIIRENRKELKEAYDRIDQCRANLDKAKRDVENAARVANNSSRMTMMGNSESNRRLNDLYRLEEKLQKMEKELDDATSVANEKYDKYTEGLFKRVAEECNLSNYYLEYLKIQRRYHKQALKRLDSLIPGVKDSLNTYNKKPVFGCSLTEYVNMSNTQTCVSPVIKKLIEGMCKQKVFEEEGIFRVAGSRIKMNCILYAINAGYLEYLDTGNDYDVHCLAGVLKQYIRELPDSILCNDLNDEWINSINTPMPKKLDAFKYTLQKLPRANYENLRYLIKFLAKIVENSDKTKMTTTNMGICFGVSLLSSSKSMSSSSSINNLSSASQSGYETSGRSIDMATATNVFDFLLTNHYELFPGEINFLTGAGLTARQSFHQTSNKSTNIQSGEQFNYREHKTSLNTSTTSFSEPTSSTHSNRYSVMVNESSLNDSPNNFNFVKQQNLANNSFVSPSPSSSNKISHINRHIKNNSIDANFTDSDSTHSVKMFPSLASQQANSNSTISLDSGSSSPKMRSKKQAPAPPKTDPQNIAQIQASPIETVNEEIVDSQSPLSTSIISTSSVNNINVLNQASLSNSKHLTNNSETSISSTASTSSNNLMSKLSSSNEPTAGETPTAPTRSSSFKLSENSFSLEKPNQPPPQVPIRTNLPQQQSNQHSIPIGFNLAMLMESEPELEIDSTPFSINSPLPKTENSKNKENINSQLISSVSSSTSSTSSLSHDLINPSSKPPKPTLPRRLGNGIAAYLNKFEKNGGDGQIEENKGDKSPSEVTSL